ncbi:hypothetical protein FRC09_002694 [Ceratobasidium sp. 395]|nr:hypothetical protein FRC09_002694 [Ceratobasidium sp. 395]
MARYNSHVRKTRSPAQKAHIEKLREQVLAARSGKANDVPASDTQVPPPSAHRSRKKGAKKKVTELRATVKQSNISLLGALEGESNTNAALKDVQTQANRSAQEAETLEKLVEQYSQELATAYSELEIQYSTISGLKNRQIELNRSRDTMRKKIQRLISRNATVKTAANTQEMDLQTYQLKNKSGVIQPEVRDMIRKLVCKGVSTEQILDIINIVAEALGISISGSVSARSVARVMLEGLVQARMQIGHELSQADYFSICGDGTTIKNVQHEAKSLYLQVRQPNSHSEPSSKGEIEQKPIFRTLGVQKAINHTSESQLQGWIVALDSLCSVFTQSSLGQKHSLTSKMIAPKLRGVLTDHAADQKRFFQLVEAWKRGCDRQARAVPKLQSMSTEEQLHLLSTYLDDATNSVGDWQTLPTEQQAALIHDAWFALASQIGEAQFQQLDPKLQGEVDFLAWVGCCMHKELNAVKGGVGSMAKAWESCSLTPPIALKNKFEAAKPLQGQPTSQYMRGAVKLASLAGALFNNKDDKKGYQSTVDHFFEVTQELMGVYNIYDTRIICILSSLATREARASNKEMVYMKSRI